MQISFSNRSHITRLTQVKITDSRNPVKLFQMMKLYSNERKDRFINLEALLNSFNSIFTRCKLRFIKDELGNLIAAYTYKLRKNRLNQKSMYIDVLVRDRENLCSKEIMPYIYQDIKQIAKSNNAEELTLFSLANDTALRSNYEQLGFKKDERVWVTGGYVMRVRTNDFLKNT